jgi:hypothetical protein
VTSVLIGYRSMSWKRSSSRISLSQSSDDATQETQREPAEVLAVLRISPDLRPCQKFRRANIYQFAEHLNEGSANNV